MNLTRVIKNILFLLVTIFSGLTLVIITAGVTSGSGELTPFNTAIEQAVLHIRTDSLTHTMLFITNIGSPFVLSMVAILLAIALVIHRDIYDTMLYIVSMSLAIVAFVVMKNELGIARPLGSLVVDLSGWSFPSGHATVATSFFFVTGYSFFHWPKHWPMKISLATFCIIGAGLVSFSRVYLGAHFAIDVLAGIALGLLSVSLTVLIFNVFLSEREWWRKRVMGM